MEYYHPEFEFADFQSELQEVLDLLEKDALVTRGGNPVRNLLINMPPRHAKLLADDTPMLTTFGWKTHGELMVGDQVFGPDGKPTTVIATTEKAPANVRITMTDGASFLCNEDHLWTVYSRPEKAWKTVRTGYWLEKAKTRSSGTRCVLSGKRSLYQLPDTPCVHFPERSLPLPPYALGAWLGDGTTGKPAVTHHEDDTNVVEAIAEHYPVSRSFRHTVGSKRTFTTYFGSGRQGVECEMTLGLKATGVFRCKRIPAEYQLSGVDQRLELLAGIVDTDGSVESGTGRVRIVTVVKELADDYMELATGLGFRPYLLKSSPSGKGKQDVYTVGFQPSMPIPTRIPRKKITRIADRRAVGIKSVEYVGGDAVGNCITVDREDGLYLAGRSLTVTHNSFNSTINLPAYALMRKPEREIMVTAYNAELAATFGRATRDIVTDERACKPFSNFGLSKDSRAVDFWKTQNGGAYYAVGLGGTTTGRGANCLTGDTEILATTGRGATIATTIKAIVESQEPVHVLAYDHETGAPAWGRAYAFSATEASEVYVIRFADGTVLRATSEHPIYVSGRGYVEAKDVTPGDLVVRVLQEGHAEAGIRGSEGEEERTQGLLLLSGVQQEPSCGEEYAALRCMRSASEAEWREEVLQRGMQVLGNGREEDGDETEEHEAVSAVPQGVQSTQQCIEVLLNGVQEYASLAIHDGSRKSTADARSVCREETASYDQSVHEGEAEDSREGWHEVRRVQRGEEASRSPHRPQRTELRVVKSCDALPDLSQQAPQAFRQTRNIAVSSVERVREECFVYNISVEGFENYFANGVLTHNCLIIDDPYKSREEADSATGRRKVWDFYTAGLLSRMQPDKEGQPAFQIVTHTRWHPDDMTGRIMDSPEYKRGEWHHLNFQALNERAKKVYVSRSQLSHEDERRIPNLTNGAVGAEGDPNRPFIDVGAKRDGEAAKVMTAAGEFTSLWPKRFDVDWLLKQRAAIGEREFAALYQQSPYIVGGNILKTSWLKRYDTLEMPEMHAVAVAVDTAFKARNSSDYSVFSVGGITSLGDIYLMKVIREKLEFPDLKRKAIAVNAAYRGQGLRGFWVEDKASGQSLIQELRNDSGVPVIPWRVGTDDKVARANSITPLIEAGRVFVPQEAEWLDTWLSEISAFPSVKNDDQVDSFVMLIDVLSRMVVSGMKEFSAPLGDLVGLHGDIKLDSGLLFSDARLEADPNGWLGKGGFGASKGVKWTGWGE